MKTLDFRALQRLQQAAQQSQQITYSQPVQWQQEGEGDGTPPAAPSGDRDEPLGEAGYKTMKAERDRANALEKQLRELEKTFQGIDPEQYARLQASQKAAQQVEEEAAKRTAQLQAESEARIQEAQKESAARVAAVKTHTEKVVLEALLQREYVAAGCDPERMAQFLKGWADDFKLEYDGDLPSLQTAKIVPHKDGKPVYTQNENKETVPIKASDYIAKGKDSDYSIFYTLPGGGTGTYSTGKGGQRFDAPPKNASDAWARL
jgi:hypothetical protein